MKIDAGLVRKVAALAALELPDGEADAFAVQLTRIVDHFEELRAIPESELQGAGEPGPMPLRADEAHQGESAFVARNAPAFSHGHFVVPRVVQRPG